MVKRLSSSLNSSKHPSNFFFLNLNTEYLKKQITVAGPGPLSLSAATAPQVAGTFPPGSGRSLRTAAAEQEHWRLPKPRRN